jgi:O-antigen biosynthesis protein
MCLSRSGSYAPSDLGFSSSLVRITAFPTQASARLSYSIAMTLMSEPELAATNIIDGIRSQNLTEDQVRGHYSLIRKTMLAADLCFATTQELAFHMRGAGKTVHVLPNGFSQLTHDVSRQAARDWRKQRDGLIRIGYAGGSRTR